MGAPDFNNASAESFSYTLEVTGLDYNVQVIEIPHSEIQRHREIAASDPSVTTGDLIAERFLSLGVDEEIASKAANTIDVLFYRFGGVKQGENGVANGAAQSEHFYGSNENAEARLPQLCVIKMPDPGGSAAEWVSVVSKGAYQLEEGYPPIFDEMAEYLVRAHEQGHCFEADETQAELMGVYQLSNEYGDTHPTELVEFLEIMEDARASNSRHEYAGISVAMRHGMDEITSGATIASDADIRGAMIKGEIPSFNFATAPPHTINTISDYTSP